mmetsp:Transcript_31364/g.47971  ORF Transcript_31364/g.47971 Transcript_31364/m.47971 type:complete len:93 (+) Transcript_31364:3335-3613(+)
MKTEFWKYQTEQCLLDAQTARVEADLSNLLEVVLSEGRELMKKNEMKRLFFLIDSMPVGIRDLVQHRVQRQALLDIHLLLKLTAQSSDKRSS